MCVFFHFLQIFYKIFFPAISRTFPSAHSFFSISTIRFLLGLIFGPNIFCSVCPLTLYFLQKSLTRLVLYSTKILSNPSSHITPCIFEKFQCIFISIFLKNNFQKFLYCVIVHTDNSESRRLFIFKSVHHRIYHIIVRVIWEFEELRH